MTENLSHAQVLVKLKIERRAMAWRPEVVRFICNRLFDLSVLFVIGAALAQMAYARNPSLESRVKRAITRLFRSPFGKQF